MKPCKFTVACQPINNIYLTLNMRAKNTKTWRIQNNCRLLTKFAIRRVQNVVSKGKALSLNPLPDNKF